MFSRFRARSSTASKDAKPGAANASATSFTQTLDQPADTTKISSTIPSYGASSSPDVRSASPQARTGAEVAYVPPSRTGFSLFSSGSRRKSMQKNANSPVKRIDRERADDTGAPITMSESVTIFDWDDTLCPTWWVWHVLAFGLSGVVTEEQSSDPKMQVILKAKKDLASPTSKFRGELEAHARTVEALLRAARSVSRVSIVTMGTQPWFEHSAVFFPGLDVPALMRELDIVTYYAVIPEVVSEGMDLKVAAKRTAMAECLIKNYGLGPIRWNVLSVGDQPEEAEALRLCCRDCPHRWRRKPICKTFTVPVEPMLQDLTAQLGRMAGAISRLVLHDKDADWKMDDSGRTDALGF